jgi:hypothetical protein
MSSLWVSSPCEALLYGLGSFWTFRDLLPVNILPIDSQCNWPCGRSGSHKSRLTVSDLSNGSEFRTDHIHRCDRSTCHARRTEAELLKHFCNAVNFLATVRCSFLSTQRANNRRAGDPGFDGKLRKPLWLRSTPLREML